MEENTASYLITPPSGLSAREAEMYDAVRYWILNDLIDTQEDFERLLRQYSDAVPAGMLSE